MSEYTGIPNGWWPLEAYTNGQQVVLLGSPRIWETLADDDPRQHNCDQMGCGSVGGHVLKRVMLQQFVNPPLPEPPQEKP